MLALGRREFTLMMRNFVVYKAKTIQVAVMGLMAATLFLRTHIHPISPNDGQEIAGFLYFATLMMLFNGIAELTLTVCAHSPLRVPALTDLGTHVVGAKPLQIVSDWMLA